MIIGDFILCFVTKRYYLLGKAIPPEDPTNILASILIQSDPQQEFHPNEDALKVVFPQCPESRHSLRGEPQAPRGVFGPRCTG